MLISSEQITILKLAEAPIMQSQVRTGPSCGFQLPRRLATRASRLNATSGQLTAVVTGSSTGIGQGVCLELAQQVPLSATQPHKDCVRRF